jgi:glycerophosphoryl diester phosphodiesterase
MTPPVKLAALLLAMSLGPSHRAADPSPIPLTRAHAHNDYEHTHPLFDALAEGFCSVEADIYLVDGQLLVAHDRDQVSPTRTLESLYLDPLADRIRRNGGRLYKGGPPAILLIDVKSDAEPTYRVLRQVLLKYTNIFTRFADGQIATNALTAIISGNRPRQIMANEPVRYAAVDGRPEDLKADVSKDLVPLVSEDWKRLFRWRGTGPLPGAEKERLRTLVETAHGQGRKVRFWGTPDTPQMWSVLWEAGVDLLNADDLAGLRKFLTSQAAPP